MDISNNSYLSIEQVRNQYLSGEKTQTAKPGAGYSFTDYLKLKENQLNQSSKLTFSKHAMNRLSERNISLTEEQMQRLNEGTGKAQSKGIKDSLVLVDNLAFIVNIPNSTVVTAMDQTEAEQNIFTNIDGAVIN